MEKEQTEKSKEKNDNKDAAVKPDPETLNTTDPQEHMEGPISSLIHKAGEGFESDGAEKEAREKKEKE
ncbi:MAG: hypothetical protein ABJA57_09385 [Ginsengibacter sp.]